MDPLRSLKMNVPSKLSKSNQLLTKRYLIWCYKTTKEDLDRIDRYYTQLKIDQFVLDQLVGEKIYRSDDEYQKLVKNFEEYMFKKKDNVDAKKFRDITKNILDPNYIYLQKRFVALEEAIKKFLGESELKKIETSYEEEMTRRIWEARDH
jgi:hypothetical protein